MKLLKPRLRTTAIVLSTTLHSSFSAETSGCSICGRCAGWSCIRLPGLTTVSTLPPNSQSLRAASGLANPVAGVSYLQPPPHAVNQPLNRLERRLVSHLPALGDPVAEVEIRQPQQAAALDLPENVVCAVARSSAARLEEGVDRGQPVVQAIDQAHHAQLALVAKLEKIGGHVAVEQEVLVLLPAVLVHAATGVPVPLILQVKRVMFAIELQT